MSKFNNFYRIESCRLNNWDYSSPGAYYLTIVTHNRENLFGEIENNKMVLNDAGKIVYKCWMNIPEHFPHVMLDEMIIMPNHLHGIIFIIEKEIINNQNIVETHCVETQNFASLQIPNSLGNQFGPQSRNLGSIIRGFKIGVTKWYREQGINQKIWQPRFYDHIIRYEAELKNIRQYIINNPLKWNDDCNH